MPGNSLSINFCQTYVELEQLLSWLGKHSKIKSFLQNGQQPTWGFKGSLAKEERVVLVVVVIDDDDVAVIDDDDVDAVEVVVVVIIDVDDNDDDDDHTKFIRFTLSIQNPVEIAVFCYEATESQLGDQTNGNTTKWRAGK